MSGFEKTLNGAYEELATLGEKVSLGKTISGRDIWLFRFGTGKKRFLATAGVHGREWITVLLLAELIKREGKGYAFDCILCLNPDGACLATDGITSVEERRREGLIRINGGTDFSMWKANARGVDVNVNFDADWGEGKYNKTSPAPSDYIGKEPESEEETRAAVKAMTYGYPLIVCYHSLGEEVYWGYEHNFRHYGEAKAYARHVGYELKRSEHSCGGMKDYYALRYDGLGLTVEVGEETYGHPYPTERKEELVKRHTGSIPLLAALGEKIDDGLHGGSAGRREKGF